MVSKTAKLYRTSFKFLKKLCDTSKVSLSLKNCENIKPMFESKDLKTKSKTTDESFLSIFVSPDISYLMHSSSKSPRCVILLGKTNVHYPYDEFDCVSCQSTEKNIMQSVKQLIERWLLRFMKGIGKNIQHDLNTDGELYKILLLMIQSLQKSCNPVAM